MFILKAEQRSFEIILTITYLKLVTLYYMTENTRPMRSLFRGKIM